MRRKMSNRRSRRLFKRTARRVHRRNLPKRMTRGGIRL